MIVLTNSGEPSTIATYPSQNDNFLASEIADLERYLDATRSTLLYARKVILVEGPAELFLLPPLIKKVLEIDLERFGVSVIPIYGVHFDVYAKLFKQSALPKKCAIIADGDLRPSDSFNGQEDEEIVVPDLNELSSEYVGVFRCKTTFERAITIPGTLKMLEKTAEEFGAKKTKEMLNECSIVLADASIEDNAKRNFLSETRQSVLNTSKRFGKARFAQVASKHVDLATGIPTYIKEAIDWLDL